MKRTLVSVLVTGVLIFLSACGSGNGFGSLFGKDIEDYIADNYTLYDTVASTTYSDDYAAVYRAQNQDLSSVADDLMGYAEPTEKSDPKDGKQIFVYDGLFVTLTQKNGEPDTMIEVAGEDFARDNYTPGFFEGYLLASVIDNLFDSGWRASRSQQCRANPDRCYDGYGSSGGFVGKNKTPSVRGAASTVRGGGPGSGK